MKNLILNEGYEKSIGLITKGFGAKIKLNNKNYFDLSNCAGSIILGHNNIVFKKALSNISKKEISNFAFPNIYAKRLAELVVKKIPQINKVIFCNSGSEAIYKSIRISKAANKKKKIVSATGDWHGSVDQLLYSPSKKLEPKKMSEGLSEYDKKNLIFIPYNDILSSKKILEKHKKNINCIIIEPVQGCLPQKNVFQYLKFLENFSKKNNIVLIFDEMITGFRLKEYSIQNKYKIKPDITTLGKIAGGGLPIGIIGINNKIQSLIQKKKIFYGGTFSGNSISTYIGYNILKKIINNKDIIRNINKKSKFFQDELNYFFEKKNFDAQVFRHESILRIVYSKKKIINRSSRDFFEKAKLKKVNKLRNYLFDNKILYPSSGIIFISYVLNKRSLDYIINKFKSGFNKFF